MLDTENLDNFLQGDYSNQSPEKIISQKNDFDKNNDLLRKFNEYKNPFIDNNNTSRPVVNVKRIEREHQNSFENNMISQNSKHSNTNNNGSDNRNLLTKDLYEKVTGKSWESAKESGITDGSIESNLKLRKQLLNDSHYSNKESTVREDNSPKEGVKNSQIKASSFNEAFKIARDTHGPNHIFEYEGRKYGTNVAGEVFKPSDEVIKSNGMSLSKTKERLDKQNNKMLSPYTSSDVTKLEKPKYSKWENIKKRQAEDNKLEEVEKVIKYRNSEKHEKGGRYVIVDKKKGLVHLYENGKSEPIMTSPVGLGAEKSDAQTVTVMEGKKANFALGNKSTGAGVYTISAANKVNLGGLPSFNLKNANGIEVGTAFHSGKFTPDPKDELDRVSNGCIRCNAKTLKDMYSYLKEGDSVYILPEEEGNTFEFENDTLAFKARSKTDYSKYKDSKGEVRKGQGANIKYAKEDSKGISIAIPHSILRKSKIEDDRNTKYTGVLHKASDLIFGKPEVNKTDKVDKVLTDKYITPFAQSIVSNKKSIMKKTKISNDEYNDIASLALGIYGNESRFGTSAKYAIKESIPSLVNIKKKWDGDNSANSRGLTQMKYSAYSKEVKDMLKEVGVSNAEDLNDPSKAAIATVALLGHMYNNELKGTKLLKDSGVSWQDALMYVYQGKKSHLSDKTATPDKNKYIKGVKKFASQFTINQKN